MTADVPTVAFESIPDGIQINVPPIQDKQYHLFLSHSDNDEDMQLVRHLRSQLEAKRFRCFEPEAGQAKMSDLDPCRRIIAIISKPYMDEKWQELETANHIEQGTYMEERVLIPILHKIQPYEVPSYVKEVNYLQTTDEFFWKKLIKALTESTPLSAGIPAGDIAEGLAWSYYYGYLLLILPGLMERVQNAINASEVKSFDGKTSIPLIKGISIFPKFIILLPASCSCAMDIKEKDSNITFVGFISFEVTRSGNIKRDYRTSVLKIKDPDSDKEYYVMLEYATPLWSMYEMEMGRIAGLGQQEKLDQMEVFENKLQEILCHPKTNACRDKHVMLSYNDRDPEVANDPHGLSRAMVRLLQQQEGLLIQNDV